MIHTNINHVPRMKRNSKYNTSYIWIRNDLRYRWLVYKPQTQRHDERQAAPSSTTQHSLATLSLHTPAAYQINKYTQRDVTHTQTPDSPSPTAINPHSASSTTAVRRGSMTAGFPSLSINAFVVCDIDKRARLPTQPQTNQPYTACQTRLDNSGLKGCD